ncbi:MAG: PilZ domain-containing protein [Methylobacter sp.]|nr:PilZ domain-containing protein [Methylobacter sp.]
MSDFEDTTETIDDFFSFDSHLPKKQFHNQRITTRYIRDDIKALVFTTGLLNFGHRRIRVDLIDISSKGVLISTSKKLGINKKVILALKFGCGNTFKINAKIVRKSDSSNYQYGIKFDQYNNALGDYLLETQSKLIFK